MLDRILQKHELDLVIVPVTDSVPVVCDRCHGIDRWQPYGNDQWFCTRCDPPPAASMVARRSGVPTIVMSVAYAVGCPAQATASVCGNRIQFKSFRTRPVCECGSHMVVENTWSDGIATYECASCAAGIATERIGDRHA